MKQKTIKKSVLKENYYYEFKPFYDTLPDELAVPSYRTELFPKAMTNKEILETYNIIPSKNIEGAFAMIADCIPTLKNDYKSRIAYFIDEQGIPCRLDVWRGGYGGLFLYVFEVFPDGGRGAGDGVLVSNETETLSTDDTLSSDTLALTDETKNAIALLKTQGFRNTRTETKEIEY